MSEWVGFTILIVNLPTYSYLRRYSMKAQEARAMYNKPYTLDEILNHIKSRAHESLSVHGYKSTRLNHEVRDTLERLGYTVTWLLTFVSRGKRIRSR